MDLNLPFALPNLQADLKNRRIRRQSPGGHITVEVDLTKTVTGIILSPECFQRAEPAAVARTLQDTLNEALREAEHAACQALLSAAKPYLPKG